MYWFIYHTGHRDLKIVFRIVVYLDDEILLKLTHTGDTKSVKHIYVIILPKFFLLYNFL